MAEVYQAADAYVTPYRAEGFNIPALEAAACGLLVVASAGGPTDEFLPEGSLLRVSATEERVYDQQRRALGVMLRPDQAHLKSQMLVAMYDDERRSRAEVEGPSHIQGGSCARGSGHAIH